MCKFSSRKNVISKGLSAKSTEVNCFLVVTRKTELQTSTVSKIQLQSSLFKNPLLSHTNMISFSASMNGSICSLIHLLKQ